MITIKNIYGADLYVADTATNVCEAVEAAARAGAYLYGADLRGADLRGADLYGAYLTGADLRDASLACTNLRGADLAGANLRGADLADANLRDANLRGADLCGADLAGANLRGANLRDANLCSADLRGANLRGADLRESTWAQAFTDFPIYNFSVGRHLAVATTEYLAIGCQQYPWKHWLEKFESIGKKEEGYSEQDIANHGACISLFYKLLHSGV